MSGATIQAASASESNIATADTPPIVAGEGVLLPERGDKEFLEIDRWGRTTLCVKATSGTPSTEYPTTDTVLYGPGHENVGTALPVKDELNCTTEFFPGGTIWVQSSSEVPVYVYTK